MSNYSLTLIRNQSTPARFVRTVTYERSGDKVTPIERKYTITRDGRRICTGSRVLPWPSKCWANAYNGETGTHKRPFTIKRDWLQLHEGLRYQREGQAALDRGVLNAGVV